jgi:FtsP/CotA-like multicopper oxidase with cupredoxin domain
MIEPNPRRNESQPVNGALAFGAVTIGVLGVIALVVAVMVGTNSDSTSVATSSAPAAVTLADLKITPTAVATTTSAGIHVTNTGAMQHNLAVEGTALATPMVDPGKSADLDLSSLAPGDYTLYCQVPGHKDAGMKAALHLTKGSGTATAAAATSADASMANMDMSSSGDMTPAQMDQAMKASITAFPAKTEGLGGQVMAPTILPDGTKQFELTAAVTNWEESPGKFVQAWTYNGTVPGPTIKVNDGDNVQVVLHNRLPESTSIHFHGIQTPNDMDGTTFVTQDPVQPGQDFTYTFVAHGPAVGMYHSHHDAVKQVPDGLAGAFLIGDEPVPSGVTVTQQQVMVLNDSGVLSYSINGKSFPATAPIVAKQGDWVEVQYLNEGTQIHPMHLHGMPQQVIAKDGYPLANPELEDTVTVAPGERYTVLVHATEPGTWVWHCHILPHAENENGMFGMVTALVVQ